MDYTGYMCIICGMANILETLRPQQTLLGGFPLKYFYLTFIFLTIFSSFAYANSETDIKSQAVLTVQVINKTANGSPVTNDEIILQIYQHQQLVNTLEAKAAEDGNAVFENIPTGEQCFAIPLAKHKEMMFTGQIIKLSPGEDKFNAQVEVFEVSKDKTKLSVQTHHLIVKASPETKSLEITEFMQITNSSDMAISSNERDEQGNAIVLNIMLPEGFSNLQWTNYFEKNAVIVTKNGFYDVMAVPPGSYQATFSYTLDISSSTMDIVKKVSLPTANCMIFAQGDVQLLGRSDADVQSMNMNGVSMEYLKFTNLAPAQDIYFKVTGLTVDKHNWITWIILTGIFGVMIIFAIVRSGKAKN